MLYELLVEAAHRSAPEMRALLRLGSLHMKRRLGVAGDMGNDALKDLRLVSASCTQFDVEVLQLDLLSSKIITKTSELALLILLAIFSVELMAGYALPHGLGILFQAAAHGEIWM